MEKSEKKDSWCGKCWDPSTKKSHTCPKFGLKKYIDEYLEEFLDLFSEENGLAYNRTFLLNRLSETIKNKLK